MATVQLYAEDLTPEELEDLVSAVNDLLDASDYGLDQDEIDAHLDTLARLLGRHRR